MLFSVIIPIYKVENYLRECVDSVLSQTYADFEIVLVDDGSPDDCHRICDEYAQKDSRIKVVHQANAGLASARNAGIKIATGEYIVCIDSDDYLIDNGVLQKIADKTVDGVDVVLYGYQKLFESNNAFGACDVPVLKGRCLTAEMLQEVLRTDTYCGTAWTKAVKLSLLHENGIEFRTGMISEDIDWYLHILCYAKTFDSINEVAVIYRQRPGSISHAAKLQSLTDNLWILENWPQRFKNLVSNHNLVDSMLSIMAFYFANDLILYAGYPFNVSRPYRDRLKAQSYLLDYAITARALIVRRFYRAFGFKITVFLLKVLSKIKTRQ